MQLLCVCLVFAMHICTGVNSRSLTKLQDGIENSRRGANDNDDVVDSSESGDYLHISFVGKLNLHFKRNMSIFERKISKHFSFYICNFLIIACLFWSESNETKAETTTTTTVKLKMAIRKIDVES